MSLKRINPTALVEIVSLVDPAIDQEKSDLKAYSETHDIKHLSFKEGHFPTIFVIKNIGAEAAAEISGEHYQVTPATIDAEGNKVPSKVKLIKQGKMIISYFKAGVKCIKENGVESLITPDELDSTAVSEVGSFIMVRTTVTDQEKKS